MTPTREQIYAGLFSLLTARTPTPFLSVGRRLPFVEEYPAEQMPACFQLQISEEKWEAADSDQGLCGWLFNVDWYVYVSQPDTDSPASPTLNDAVSNLTDIFHFGTDEQTALNIGGVQFPVLLRGPIDYWEGLLGQKAVAIIPLQIQVNQG